MAVFNGGVDVAAQFTGLPFDHLVFTGSTNVGRIVMRAAAENLTPVTLELGGKSPALIHPDFPVKEAARRLAFGKTRKTIRATGNTPRTTCCKPNRNRSRNYGKKAEQKATVTS